MYLKKMCLENFIIITISQLRPVKKLPHRNIYNLSLHYVMKSSNTYKLIPECDYVTILRQFLIYESLYLSIVRLMISCRFLILKYYKRHKINIIRIRNYVACTGTLKCRISLQLSYSPTNEL